ncbi:MAG: helix-turn-helix domain-containing protein [Actinomycetia bacterium]|nr:helix-turn-helix domain-containing protein [Actinomycetes bacterium]
MADESNDLDAIFEALANKHRRAIVYAVGLQPHSITQLADMRDLSLPAIHKHIKILESAGLVVRRKMGRTNFLTLDPRSLQVLEDWLQQYHTYWGSAQATLQNYAHYLEEKR